MRAATRRRVRRWIFIGVSATIGILVIAGLALPQFSGGGLPQPGTEALDYTEGVGTPVDLMPSVDHRPIGEAISYSTTPPTSGPHWGTPEWADCGIHEAGIPDERIVHNMEHGQVVISYNLPNEEDAARMIEVAKRLPDLESWGVVRPYDKIEAGTVGLTAWGVKDVVKGVDEDRIKLFYTTYARNRFSEETSLAGPIRCTSAVG